MTSKIIISNLAQFLNIISQHPELLQVPPFQPLERVLKEVRAATMSCGCNASSVYEANKGIFTAAITSMQPSDHMMVKNILKVRELCFFVVAADGKVALQCH
ncbi:MAG: hypothetical protein EBU46_08925 [Nitrosomonadaceae bacterium]|nr:hypothetical protein [Nitrosomonadaceae bacterium]